VWDAGGMRTSWLTSGISVAFRFQLCRSPTDLPTTGWMCYFGGSAPMIAEQMRMKETKCHIRLISAPILALRYIF